MERLREREIEKSCRHNFNILVSDGIVGDSYILFHSSIVECSLCGRWKNISFEEKNLFGYGLKKKESVVG